MHNKQEAADASFLFIYIQQHRHVLGYLTVPFL